MTFSSLAVGSFANYVNQHLLRKLSFRKIPRFLCGKDTNLHKNLPWFCRKSFKFSSEKRVFCAKSNNKNVVSWSRKQNLLGSFCRLNHRQIVKSLKQISVCWNHKKSNKSKLWFFLAVCAVIKRYFSSRDAVSPRAVDFLVWFIYWHFWVKCCQSLAPVKLSGWIWYLKKKLSLLT